MDRTHVQRRGGVLVMLVLLAAPACRQAARLDSPNPYERARAAVERVESGDHAAVHQLVALLEDDDPGVRFYAILALRRLCAEDFGYEPYADEPARIEAVRRWRAALQRGELTVRRAAAPTTAPATADG